MSREDKNKLAQELYKIGHHEDEYSVDWGHLAAHVQKMLIEERIEEIRFNMTVDTEWLNNKRIRELETQLKQVEEAG